MYGVREVATDIDDDKLKFQQLVVYIYIHIIIQLSHFSQTISVAASTHEHH